MKKIFFGTMSFLLAGVLFQSVFAARTVPMGAVTATMDTVTSYQAGPGCVYTQYLVTKGSKVRTVHVLDVDLNNPYNKVEVRIAQDKIGVSETLAKMSARWDAEGHRMVGGINCTPYIMSVHEQQIPYSFDGLATHPTHAVCTNGIPVCSESDYDRGYADANPLYETGYLAIDNTKTAFVNDFHFTGSIVYDEKTVEIDEFNRPRKFAQEDRITVYSPLIPTTPAWDCQEVVFSIDQWITNTEMTCKVVSVNTKGGTTLANGQGAIQAICNAKTQISDLKAGDTFSLTINMTPRDNSPVGRVEHLTGGYSLNMCHDTLTNRNYDEAYNSGDYPRPMMGTSPDGKHLWLIEMKTPGMTTEEGCYILKSFGAINAAAFDGGGSAQMFVNGGYVMNSTDGGGERALPVALWVVATAPDTDAAGRLEFVNPLASIPAYASYTPQVRAWSKEGLFLGHDYKKHTLSCEPASLGTISEDGLTFTANPAATSGKLIASYGNTKVETPVEIRDGKVEIVLDTVWVSINDYEVEVIAIAGDLQLPLSAKALDWTSLNNDICTINQDGLLHPVANGKTQVIGTLSDFCDTLNVMVEMPTLARHSADTWQKINRIPFDTVFAFASIRNAALSVPLNMQLFGMPDSVLFVVNTDSPVQSMELDYRANNGESQREKIDGITAVNTDYTYSFCLTDLLNSSDQAIYPIWIETAKFAMKKPTANKDYNCTIKDIILCYKSWKATRLEEVKKLPAPTKIMVDGQIYIVDNEQIFTIDGKRVK